MHLFFIFSFFTTLIISLFINSLRALTTTKKEKAQGILNSFFWYKSLHRFLFKTEEISTFIIVSSITRFILLFFTIATGVLLFNELKNLIFLFLAIWIFIDILPKILGVSYAEKILKITSGIVSLLLFATLPLNIIFLNLPKKILKPLFETENPEFDLTEVLEDVKRKSSLDIHNKKLLEAVVTFKDRIAREVMVPRLNVFCLSETMSILEASEQLSKEGYSRIPIYKGTIDSIVGVLMYKDILHNLYKCLTKEKSLDSLNEPISTLIKPVIYTPETKKVSQLLQDFKAKQMHLAIVVDEYGGTEGIITIEDIIEEIVGDISDEYDIEEDRLYTEQPSGGWIVDAKMSILDVEEHFGIKLSAEGDFDTIGGFIFQRSGTIPKKGFHIYLDELELEVLSATDRTIGKVCITPTQNIKSLTLKEKDLHL
jgi:putative hemolysin